MMIESFLEPIPSGRLLHILEVDQDFKINGSQPYKEWVTLLHSFSINECVWLTSGGSDALNWPTLSDAVVGVVNSMFW